MQKTQKVYNVRALYSTMHVNSITFSIASNILFILNPDLVLRMHFHIILNLKNKRDNVLWIRFISYRANLLHHIVRLVYENIDT